MLAVPMFSVAPCAGVHNGLIAVVQEGARNEEMSSIVEATIPLNAPELNLQRPSNAPLELKQPAGAVRINEGGA